MKVVLTLRDQTFATTTMPVGTSWLLAECMEFRGKQELWMRQRPEVLRSLREQAVIRSVESSNRIEGVTIPANRLRPVVLKESRPRDRSEEELAGYRRALDWIYARKRPVRIDGRVVRHLHALAQAGAGDAGEWKRVDNEIVELTARGPVVRFRPTAARHTPAAVDLLCENWNRLLQDGQPVLLLLATFVFDFLCIHPFRDGNGRVGRLLTTLLLQQNGFLVGRYVSLERLVEESRDDYYRVLAECSAGWASGGNEILPWWNYFLGIVRRAYREFGQQIEGAAGQRASKASLVRQAVLAWVGDFTLAEVRAQVPAVSEAMVKAVLGRMKQEGLLRVTGHGRSARWERR